MSITKTKIVAVGLLGLVTWAFTASPAHAQIMRGGRMGVMRGPMGSVSMMPPSPMMPIPQMTASMMGQPVAGMGRFTPNMAMLQSGMFGFNSRMASGLANLGTPGMNMSVGGMGMGGAGYGMGSAGSGMGGGNYGAGNSNSGQNPYASGSTSSQSGSQKVELPHPTGGKAVAPANAAVIQLQVPDQFAVVSFDGQNVESVGTTRTYVTPEFAPGKSQRYEIKVSWGAGNQQTSMEKAVEVRTGQVSTADFTHIASGATR